MVRKLTLFEAHFDGTQFGPTFGDADEELPTDEESDGPENEAATAEPSGSRIRPVLAVLGVLAVVSVVARVAVPRFRGGGDVEELTVEDVDAPEEPAVQ